MRADVVKIVIILLGILGALCSSLEIMATPSKPEIPIKTTTGNGCSLKNGESCPTLSCANPVFTDGACCPFCPVRVTGELSGPDHTGSRSVHWDAVFQRLHKRASPSYPSPTLQPTYPTPTIRSTTFCPVGCTYEGTFYCEPVECRIRCVDGVRLPGSCCYECLNGISNSLCVYFFVLVKRLLNFTHYCRYCLKLHLSNVCDCYLFEIIKGAYVLHLYFQVPTACMTDT